MIPLAYIASPSYSGSTLLAFLLNAHPQVATMGELKWASIDLDTYRCSCGTLLPECELWRFVGQRVTSRGVPFDLARPMTDFRCRASGVADRVARARVRGAAFESVRGALLAALPASRRSFGTIREVNRAIMEAILEYKKARVFVDASKDPVRLRHLHRTGDYDLRVLQLVRDGRGVVNSSIRHDSRSADIAAQEWLRTHRQIERIAGDLGAERVLRVRYEDLCASPAAELSRIWAFLEVEPCTFNPNYRAAEHHILGNSMRLRAETAIRLDEKWRQQLSEAQLASAMHILGQANRAYGYT